MIRRYSLDLTTINTIARCDRLERRRQNGTGGRLLPAVDTITIILIPLCFDWLLDTPCFFSTAHSNGIDYLFPGLCSNEFVEYSDMELWRELIIIPSGSLQHLIPVVVVLALWCYNNFVNIHTITGKVSYTKRI